MENHRNGIVEKSVLLTHIPNLRYQRVGACPGPALPGLRSSYVFRNPPRIPSKLFPLLDPIQNCQLTPAFTCHLVRIWLLKVRLTSAYPWILGLNR